MSASRPDALKAPVFPIYQMMDDWAAWAYSSPEVKAQHHALYFALLTIVKNKGGQSRFSLPYQTGMEASSIGSRSTYIKALQDLERWGKLTYTPGANAYQQAVIDVHFCTSTGHLLDIYRSSIATSTDTSAGHIIKDLYTSSLKDESGQEQQAAALARAEKKIAQLQAQLREQEEEISALKAELDPDAQASHTRGGAAPADFMPDPPPALAPNEHCHGGFVESTLSDEDPRKWEEIPQSAQMVDDYLRSIDHPKAGKGHLFYDYYKSVGWLIGNKPMRNWRFAIKSYKFREDGNSIARPGAAKNTGTVKALSSYAGQRPGVPPAP